jgi:glycosyltransferase involved in cell wall biosynthesis
LVDVPISVLMPVYNSRRFLGQSVGSILDQTFRDFEFIIIDDGSSDRSLAILERYARRDRRIRLVSRANTGYSRALNQALSMARGEFLARMDSDDVARPRRFERQLEYLRGHLECVAVGCRVLEIDPWGVPLKTTSNELDHDPIVEQLLKGAGAEIPHPGVMMRRSPVVALGGYRVEYEPVEDLDLYLRLSERGRLANLPDVLLEYRQHLASVNQLRCAEQVRLASRVVAEALRRRERPVPEDFSVPGWSMPTELEAYHSWARAAVRAGRFGAAWRHAAAIAFRRPRAVESWKIVYGVLKASCRAALGGVPRHEPGVPRDGSD